ncbi:MAG: hypothetical protein MJ244_04910 [Clostridia bacterium]|nr:hypothetical protein [Clostridia bacterium]
MKENSLKLCIVVGIILVLILPILTVATFFMGEKNNSNNNVCLKHEPKTKEISLIENNKKAKLDVSSALANNDILIEDEAMPLALDKAEVVTGTKVLSDFTSHQKDIENGNVVFELMLDNGSCSFYVTLDELKFHINEKGKYKKYFVTDNGKLVRYTYLEIK